MRRSRFASSAVTQKEGSPGEGDTRQSILVSVGQSQKACQTALSCASFALESRKASQQRRGNSLAIRTRL